MSFSPFTAPPIVFNRQAPGKYPVTLALACPPKVAGNHTGQLSSTVALIHTATLNYLIVRTLVNISWRQSTPIQHLGYRIVPVVYRQPLSPIHRFGSSPTQPTLTLQGW